MFHNFVLKNVAAVAEMIGGFVPFCTDSIILVSFLDCFWDLIFGSIYDGFLGGTWVWQYQNWCWELSSGRMNAVSFAAEW